LAAPPPQPSASSPIAPYAKRLMQYVYDSPGIAEPCRPAFNAGATEERLGECVQQLADEEHNLSGITSIKFRVFCILFFDG